MSLPVELDRDEARELAERELAHPRYSTEPPPHERVLEWIIERIARFLDATSGVLSTPIATVVLIALIIVIAVLIIRYAPVARRGGRSAADPVFGPVRRSAAEHRAEADAAAARSAWTEAVVARFRAIAAGLEERSVLEPRPGRTADEVARDAGGALPELADRLGAAARVFDQVYYGKTEAGRSDADELAALDRDVSTTRPQWSKVAT